MPDRAPPQLDAAAASRLRRLNLVVGSVHALQAVVLLTIATAASRPITSRVLAGRESAVRRIPAMETATAKKAA